MNLFKKLSVITSVFVFILLPLVIPSEVLAQGFSKETQLDFKINNIAYSRDKRKVVIDSVITNRSESFVDNLEYVFEFNQGDKLEETGLIFRNLTYIFSTSGKVEKIAPGEAKRVLVEHIVPETIPGGSYFVRGIVSNPEISVYGITYKKEPIFLTGLGGFITKAQGFLVDLKSDRSYRSTEGPLLDKDGKYAFEYRRAQNENLFEALEKEDVFADIKIHLLSDANDVVYEKKDVSLRSLINKERDSVLINIESWENIKSGPHTMVVNFKNARGDKMAEEGRVRLLYKGVFGRVITLETNVNYYRSGDPLNLMTNVFIAGDPKEEKASVVAYFKYKDKLVREVKKEITLQKSFQGTDAKISLGDMNMGRKTWVDQVELVLLDASGNELDAQVVNLDTSKKFGYEDTTGWLKPTLITLLLLIVILVIWAFVKKKININWLSLIIAIVLVSGSLIVSDIKSVSAQSGDEIYGCMDSSADNYNYNATVDDGSCEYGGGYFYGCTDSSASNYDSNANADDGSCQYYCTDPSALNYLVGSPCDYGPGYNYGCTDSTAQNYDPFADADDGSCIPGIPGCTDFTATNYDPSATYDDGTCNYSEVGCMDPTANNYNANATVDDGSCTYDTPGCTDSLALNYDATATVDDGSCQYYQWGGPNPKEMLTVYHTHESSHTVVDYDAGICTNTTKTTQFYVRLQCEACGNAGLNVAVDYYNNGLGQSSVHNDGSVVNTSEIGNGHQFYNFLFGPFNFIYVPENFDENGNVMDELYENGVYSQEYAVQASALFGAELCKLTDPETGQVYTGTVTNEEVIEEQCDLPSEIRSSFFIDEDRDGEHDSDEPYLRDGNNDCYGVPAAPFGVIRKVGGEEFSSLPSDQCEDNVPYFFKNLLEAGEYQVDIDSNNSFTGWIKTAVLYYIDSVWTNASSITIDTNENISSKVGVYLDGETPVIIPSCLANPVSTNQYPDIDVTWSVPYIYGPYDRSDLKFVWNGVGAPPLTSTSTQGGLNNGDYDITYQYGEYNTRGESITIRTYAVLASECPGPDVSSCEPISNSINCQVQINVPVASCAAFDSEEDAFDDNPKVPPIFNAGDPVILKGDLDNDTANAYDWSGEGILTGTPLNFGSAPYNQVETITSNETGAKNVDFTAYGTNDYAHSASCQFYIRQCWDDTQCPANQTCSYLGLCEIPEPEFTLLEIDPSVINLTEGERCGLSWTVDYADSCTLYKNNVAMPDNVGTSTQNYEIEPGTYTIVCQNVNELGATTTVTGGPVRCLLNPNIREQ